MNANRNGLGRRWKSLMVVCAAAMLAVSCSSTDSGGSAESSAAASGFPVEITSAFGTASIKSAPQRIVALGPGDVAVARALNGNIVLASRYTRSDTGNFPAVNPPLASDVNALQQDRLSLEQVAAARPDVILATDYYQAEKYYAELSRIAPTVTFAKALYSDPYEEVTRRIGKAIGASESAVNKLNDGARTAKEEFVAQHADIKGKGYVYGQLASDTSINLLTSTTSPATALLTSLGLHQPQTILDLPSGGARIPGASTIAPEQYGTLDAADIVLLAPHTDAIWNAFTALPVTQQLKVNGSGGLHRISFDFAQQLVAPNAVTIPNILQELNRTLKQ